MKRMREMNNDDAVVLWLQSKYKSSKIEVCTDIHSVFFIVPFI